MKLRDRAYESFRQHLLASNIRPGQFVSQRELVALTGLSLGAIRDIIPRLEADGLIVTLPKRGMQIASLDLKFVRNAFGLRQVLECAAVAAFAAEASEAQVAGLIAPHREIMHRAETGERSAELLDEAQSVDWAMHETIVDSLGNELISATYRVNGIKIRLIRLKQSLLSEDVLMSALTEHERILSAIAARDVHGAVLAMQDHIVSARMRALGVAGA